MADGNSLINVGELAKPATVLIEKISDAVGAVFQPYQIRRIAQAESDAEKIRALAKIEMTELQQRAVSRFLSEETRKQENIEAITAKSLGELRADAEPEKMDDDWVANLFDKCKLVSNEEMQSLWSKLLSGEANKPGTYSKRTVDFVATLDKRDADLFTRLCSFGWFIGEVVPLVYDVEDAVYESKDISFRELKHLDAIGLVTFDSLAGYIHTELSQNIQIHYYGTPVCLTFASEQNNQLRIGKVLLTKIGQELAPICGSKRDDRFLDYVIGKWHNFGHIVWSPLRGKPSQKD
jgi:hypothetical protein